ncbi:hypothetical protein [Entomomonas asaccharolytica]|uniref:Lipoprotein n=1 Tax=Entomomonas asaccharolytica TaxID=2785331 RepID=A0A974RVY9_9GAMM|nr:hypothetical protein [Entomomonas asaccharolytica]QQP84666.1 hypothetical protein JHT90_09615 [Entomomonas asaccharolytica]
MRISIFILCFLLVGCIPSKVIITPDTLPDAIVGELYYTEIEINGGSGPVTASGFQSTSTSNRLWVEVNPTKTARFYNSLIVHGKPINTETITVKIKGHTIPTLFLGEASFEKTYVIKVKERQ